MQTLTPEQFKAKYGEAGVSSFSSSTKTQDKKEGYFSRVTNGVGGDLAQRIDRTAEILNRKDTGTIEKGVQLFGQGAGLASNALEKTIGEIPGVKQVVEGVGSGLHWLATSDWSPIKHLGDVIGSSKTLQEVTHLYDTDNNFKDTVDALGNNLRIGGDISTIVNSANFAANVTNKVINGIKDTTSALNESVLPSVDKVAEKVKNVANDVVAPERIMNRVARLNPLDENKFVTLSGQTPGQYLTKTGNFGAPNKIIENEATKFTKSIQSVDNELAKLPGVYRNGAIEDALNGLAQTAENISSQNVPAPFKSRLDELLTKYNQEGLNMSEINEVKRLYERNVKLGYNKLLNPEKVAQATNIDSAIRNWQVKQAVELGFKNLPELNKQTQISKFIIDKLGAKIIGQAGLNSLSLTDWIVLAGGNPQSVAGFLTKKFFSSKAIQAKIAELLNRNETQGQILPQTKITPENINRKVNPRGNLSLPSGKGEFRNQKPSNGTIPVAPKNRNIEIIGKKGIIPSKQK